MRMLCHFAIAGLLACAAALAHDDEDYDIPSAHISLRSAAQHAIHEEDIPLFNMLLKYGYLINKPIEAGSGRTALHEAVLMKKIVMIRHLMKSGADPLIRDVDDDRPVDLLRYSRGDMLPTALFEALKREQNDYDKRMLLGIPVPVWREVLGSPRQSHDPLAPPVAEMPDPALVCFVSINDADPPAEMKRVLDAHYPGWRAASLIEYAEGGPSQYRDKNTKEFGRKVEITLHAGAADPSGVKNSNPFDKNAVHSAPLAYAYQIRRASGDALSGGGIRGRVVLNAGYWVKADVNGWDE